MSYETCFGSECILPVHVDLMLTGFDRWDSCRGASAAEGSPLAAAATHGVPGIFIAAAGSLGTPYTTLPRHRDIKNLRQS